MKNEEGLKFLSSVENNTVQLVLTDPPYMISKIGSGGHKYDHFDNEKVFNNEVLGKFVEEWARVLKPGGTLVCWGDMFKMETLKSLCEGTGEFCGRYRVITWEKESANNLEIKITYLGWTEYALVVSKKPSAQVIFNNKREDGSAVGMTGHFKDKLPRGKERSHPTQKPLGLFKRLVELHTNPGDLVLDSFLGSGTTALAALSTGRRFLGSEMNEEYFKKALERLEESGFTL
jgi:site-specific DNA-methyltransferase (adenine-specific)